MSEAKQGTLAKLEARRVNLDSRIEHVRKRISKDEKRKEQRRKVLAGEFLFRLLGSDWKRVGERLKGEGKLSERDSDLF